MDGILSKIKNSKAVEYIKAFLTSKFFPFVTAAVVLFCYYLGLDIIAILYIGVTGTLIMLLTEDVTPILCDLLFMRVILSWKNSPSASKGNSGYYSSLAVLIPTVFIAALLAAAMIYRLVRACVKKKFKITPVFYGLCAFCGALLLNGLFSKNYSAMSLLYGAILALLFLGLYAVFKDNISADKKCFENIAYSFTAYALLLVIELAALYCTNGAVTAGGKINRDAIVFGWGPYTSYGVLVVMCIPPAVYLAGIKKYGYVYTVFSVILLAASVLCCSRQAMVSAVIVYPVCIALLIVKGRYRIANICIVSAALVAGIVLLAVYFSEITEFLKDIFANVIVDGKLNGSGRMRLWKLALNEFKSYPVFGTGFYGETVNPDRRFPPYMYHNTVLQLMGACGIVGLGAYLFHRVQTCICYFKNITAERTVIALVILVLLINSLMDVHIFNIFPTMVYSFLLAVLVRSQTKPEAADIPPADNIT